MKELRVPGKNTPDSNLVVANVWPPSAELPTGQIELYIEDEGSATRRRELGPSVIFNVTTFVEFVEKVHGALGGKYSKHRAIIDAAIKFVAHEVAQSDAGENWIEDLKKSDSLDVPVEFLELLDAVNALVATNGKTLFELADEARENGKTKVVDA